MLITASWKSHLKHSGGGEKNQVVLRNPAHQRRSWGIQSTPSALHQQANALLQSLICISGFPHCNKSNLRKGVRTAVVWVYGPSEQGSHGDSISGQWLHCNHSRKVERWMMRHTFLFILTKGPNSLFQNRSYPFASFEGNESAMAQENHYLSDVPWLQDSLCKAAVLSWRSLPESLKGLDSLDMLRSSTLALGSLVTLATWSFTSPPMLSTHQWERCSQQWKGKSITPAKQNKRDS